VYLLHLALEVAWSHILHILLPLQSIFPQWANSMDIHHSSNCHRFATVPLQRPSSNNQEQECTFRPLWMIILPEQQEHTFPLHHDWFFLLWRVSQQEVVHISNHNSRLILGSNRSSGDIAGNLFVTPQSNNHHNKREHPSNSRSAMFETLTADQRPFK